MEKTTTSIARAKLAKNLIYLRNQRKLSKYRVAVDSGLSHCYISKLEKGEGNPSMEVLDALAAVFGVNVYELFL